MKTKIGEKNTEISEGMIELNTVSKDSKVFFKSVKSRFSGRYIRIEQADLSNKLLTIFNIDEENLKEMLDDLRKIKVKSPFTNP